MTYTKDFSYSEKASVSVGIPFLVKNNLEFTSVQKFTDTNTNTDTRTTTTTYALQQQIPALTAQEVTANASAGVITVKVGQNLYVCAV